MRFLKWQFARKPHAKRFPLLLLKRGSSILGCLGLLPVRYKIGDQSRQLRIYINLFVDPGLRSFGIGAYVVREAMRRYPHALNIGYNALSLPIFQRLGGWHELGSFAQYVILLNDRVARQLLADHSRRAPLAKQYPTDPSHRAGCTIKEYRVFNSDFDSLWRTVRNKYRNTAERTSAYLNWRYARHPYFRYTILAAAERNGSLEGYLIYRRETVQGVAVAHIIDFISSDRTEKILLHRFLADSKRQNVAFADFMFSGDYHHASLTQTGFTQDTAHVFPVLFNPVSHSKKTIDFMAYTRDPRINRKIFFNPDAWYLTRGDADQDRPNPH
ncbi:MAG: hypothetical protein HY460_01045 [Parcubacteria group bacterium]|nr:hypothetical protein [Parcubacteria group bacterium]